MNERLRDILVLSGVSILLMIGTYKCGRESKTEVITYEKPIVEVSNNEVPQLYADDENYDEVTETPTYHLIVGSFTSIDLAQNYSDYLMTEGFDPTLVEEDGYYRISIFSSIYIDEVYDTKEKYSHRLNKMWVYNQ
jgi:hypothetical protein